MKAFMQLHGLEPSSRCCVVLVNVQATACVNSRRFGNILWQVVPYGVVDGEYR